VIDEAIACRLAVARVRQEFLAKKDWFFAPWNAEEVRDPKTGKRIPFHQAPAELLATDPNCWVLHPSESWHGFEGIPDNWCMLDPIKFGIVCPGMKPDGKLDEKGLPADIVTAYLSRHGIVPSRTTDHMVLFLFSVGITKGKWGTLLNTCWTSRTTTTATPRSARCCPTSWRRLPIGTPAWGSRTWATSCGPT
jgi:arginine decarboxylase